jgi:hypothetical protein
LQSKEKLPGADSVQLITRELEEIINDNKKQDKLEYFIALLHDVTTFNKKAY